MKINQIVIIPIPLMKIRTVPIKSIIFLFQIFQFEILSFFFHYLEDRENLEKQLQEKPIMMILWNLKINKLLLKVLMNLTIINTIEEEKLLKY